MDAPSTAVTCLTSALLDQAIQESRANERGRIILPLHKSPDDSLQRMFNAMQPGTYVRPHRHVLPPKAETILVLRGCLCFMTFDDSGRVDRMIDIAAEADIFGIDVAAGIFHTFFISAPDTVVFEVKPGPYSPIDDKDFAPWAPREGDALAGKYLAGLERLRMEKNR